jgi:hypothetical protein
MHGSRTSRHDHAAIGRACERRDRSLDFAHISHIDRGQFDTEGRCHGLNRGPLADPALCAPTVGAVRPVKAALTESNYFSTRDSGGTLSPGPCERTSAPLNKAEVLFCANFSRTAHSRRMVTRKHPCTCKSYWPGSRPGQRFSWLTPR